MFPSFDPKMFEAFSADPASFLGKVAEFQRANFEAAREITENNAKAFQQLAAIRDPQQFVTAQPAILQAVVQRNMEIVTQLWQTLGGEMSPPAPKGKGKK
ncbi:phasin family protein [Paramagnetospirillum magneticum]|uniref:Phasin domain-containing protein n=1 Tax=Paramagnetospirillum magneticum (strain ATCC 700264 / AMB-1) TaxID=342108 RepID=Q2W1T5_PARM1|nr:phasin family protein [Paramagnetospirillum magneticum]BAE52190.1 hypothetical protein amb3386 [Paramagnetospirillum magneticum AMB-1]